MRAILESARRLLSEAGLATDMPEDSAALSFEGVTVLGFVMAYETPADLLARWQADVAEIVGRNQAGLRRAQRKTWNAYVVLLAAEAASYPETVAMAAVEENLTGTRKVARGGASDPEILQGALIALLPLRHAPSIAAVDMATEIKFRTTELPSHAVEAFLSGASESAVLHILDEAP